MEGIRKQFVCEYVPNGGWFVLGKNIRNKIILSSFCGVSNSLEYTSFSYVRALDSLSIFNAPREVHIGYPVTQAESGPLFLTRHIHKASSSGRKMVKRQSIRSSPKLHSSRRARVPTHWGRRTWDALFLLAADYPHPKDCEDDDEFSPEVVVERRRAWKRFLETLPGVLTCGVCSHHFESYMRQQHGIPFRDALRDRDSLFAWLHKAKAEVNKRNGRKSLTLESTKKRYIPTCSKHTSRSK